MKLVFTFFLCLLSLSVKADPDVTVYYEFTVRGYALYADNNEDYPVYLELEFDLVNLKVVREGPSVIAVPAKSSKYKLVDLVALNVLKLYSFEYSFNTSLNYDNTAILDAFVDPTAIELKDKEAIAIEVKEKDIEKTEKAKAVVAKIKVLDTLSIIEVPAVSITKVVPDPIVVVDNSVKTPVKPALEVTPAKPLVEAVSPKPAVVVDSEPKPEVLPVKKEIVKTPDEPNTEVNPIKPDEIIINKPKVVVVPVEPIVNKESVVTKPVVTKPAVTKPVVKDPVIIPDPVLIPAPDPVVVAEPVVAPVEPIVTKEPVITKPLVKDPVIIPDPVIITDPIVTPDPIDLQKALDDYVTTIKYNAAYQYELPFKKGGAYRVSQGYRGTDTHQNLFAIDLAMPVGTEIVSSREGIVAEIVQNNTKGCASGDCSKFDNYVLILHRDGSMAKYAHLKNNGVVVATGDIVKAGQFIGYSGSTGRTSAPALHFEVQRKKDGEFKSVKTNFLTGDGSDYGILMEGQFYERSY